MYINKKVIAALAIGFIVSTFFGFLPGLTVAAELIIIGYMFKVIKKELR